MPPQVPAVEAKAALRRRIRTARSRRSDAERAEAATALAARVLALPEVARASRVALTIAMATEPPTDAIVSALLARGVTVLAPRIAEGAAMTWVPIDASTTWTRSELGMAEPDGPGGPMDADVLLLPALAVAGDGRRLGQGGGYFDRALAGRPETADALPTIALVFDDEVVDDLPCEPHDRRVSIIVTPRRTLHC